MQRRLLSAMSAHGEADMTRPRKKKARVTAGLLDI